LILLFSFLGAFSLVVQTDFVSNHYIVVFHPNTTENARTSHYNKHNVSTTHKYAIGKQFFGYAAHLSSRQLLQVATSPEVHYVEKDAVVSINRDSCESQADATWGINRVSDEVPILSGDYRFNSDAGDHAEVFIIDTGIRLTHEEFEGRAVLGANFVTSEDAQDCNGHGTHVAGTVGGKNYGVSKKSTLIAVKVLSCTGSGTWAGVLGGIAFAADPVNRKGKYALANMSLGGPKNTAINDAIDAGTENGVLFVVAAGNDNSDACEYSPASTPSALTVGATTMSGLSPRLWDRRADFSNYGTCVDILAPGERITSAWYTSDLAIRTISGTSMASPHVAGAAALYLDNHSDANPADIGDFVVQQATQDIISLDCENDNNIRRKICDQTPNKLLHTTCSW